MDVVNAIAKVRFGSARPQRVQIHKGRELHVEMLCLEPGQELRVRAGEWAYYVVTGTARMAAGGASNPLAAGQLAFSQKDEPHELVNSGESRLICLVFGHPA